MFNPEIIAKLQTLAAQYDSAIDILETIRHEIKILENEHDIDLEYISEPLMQGLEIIGGARWSEYLEN